MFLCQNSKKVVSIIHKLPVNWTTKKIVANNNDDDVGGSDGNQNNDGEGENLEWPWGRIWSQTFWQDLLNTLGKVQPCWRQNNVNIYVSWGKYTTNEFATFDQWDEVELSKMEMMLMEKKIQEVSASCQ